MGKGGKNNLKPQKKIQTPALESDPQESEELDLEDSEDEVDNEGSILNDTPSEDEQLLNKIQDEIIGSEQNLKLTWAAIHTIKSKQKTLNEQMDQQMRKVKEKYDKLKQPLIHQIALAASGQKLEKQLYSQHELTKSLNLKKIEPIGIPGFWRNVFDSISLLPSAEDRQIFGKCSKVECNCTTNEQEDSDSFTIIMEFEQNDYFSNKQLKLQVERVVTSANIIQVSKIEFKKPLEGQNIFIAQLFDPYTEPYKLYQHANDIQRAYNSSVFFYFFQSKLDQEDEQQLGENKDEEDESDEDQDDEDDQSEEDIGQPVKKRKPNQEVIEKPNCQQQ